VISKHTFLRWYPLFLMSGLGLFLELAVIRWISGEVRLLSYFKNLPLLAAFLGLAIGFALVGKGRNYRPAFAPLFGLLVALVIVVGRIGSPRALAYPGSGDEFLWFTAPVSYWLALLAFLGTVLIFFVLTMLVFIPLGQATGEEMARHAPVLAYTVNILASLGGIWVFALLAYLQTSPAIWFGLGFLGVGVYLAGRRALSRFTLAAFGLTLAGLVVFGQGITWSPYQRLEVTEMSAARRSDGAPVEVGYTLNVQQVFYQHAINLSRACAAWRAASNGGCGFLLQSAFSAGSTRRTCVDCGSRHGE